MRPIPILLAFVVVLGFVSEAVAFEIIHVDHNYRMLIGNHRFGFVDGSNPFTGVPEWSEIWLGPMGKYPVPFTTTQGLVGFCVIDGGLVVLVTAATMRWKRKRGIDG